MQLVEVPCLDVNEPKPTSHEAMYNVHFMKVNGCGLDPPVRNSYSYTE